MLIFIRGGHIPHWYLKSILFCNQVQKCRSECICFRAIPYFSNWLHLNRIMLVIYNRMISSSPDTHPLPVARFVATCILPYNPQMNECNDRRTDHFTASAHLVITIIIIFLWWQWVVFRRVFLNGERRKEDSNYHIMPEMDLRISDTMIIIS